MSYTPPSGGAVNVELAGAGAYVPPASNVLEFDLALSEGSSGNTQFITVTGSVSVSGFGPSSFQLGHTLPVADISIQAFEPSYTISRTSILDVAGVVAVTAPEPTYTATQVSLLSDSGQVSVSSLEPTYFKGFTTTIDAIGQTSLDVGGEITTSTLSGFIAPVGEITVTSYQPTQVMQQVLSVVGSVQLNTDSIAQVQKIRSEVGVKYFTPDVTLDAAGEVTLQGFAPSSHGMKIRKETSLMYSGTYPVRAQVASPYTSRVAKEAGVTYSIYGTMVSEKSVQYGVKVTDRVVSEVQAGYRFPVSSETSLLYGIRENLPIRTSVTAPYTMVANVNVRSSVEVNYAFNTRLVATVGAVFNMTEPVVSEKAALFTIEAARKAKATVSCVYSMPAAQVIAIVAEPYVEYFGERLGVESADVETSEGEKYWKASIVLTHVSDYVKLKQDQPFAVVIGSERFEFIVDTKELDRGNPANYEMKLFGISPLIKFDHPRHVATSYLWDQFAQAKAVAEELIPTIDWHVLDWGIPAYRLAVQNATPVGVVSVLAQAIGATLESGIDGVPYVRSLFPVSVPDYWSVTPSHILLESTDIITVSESYVSFGTYNRLTITDVSNDISDSLEWIPDYDQSTTGTMRAFLYPWRSGVELKHTGLPGVFIDSPTMGMERHEEIIEVFQSQGSTQYPIHHVESVQYEASNVGSLVFDIDSRSFTVSGPLFNSVIRLVYWTRSYDYRVAMPEARPTQFLLESAPL